jgi:hypothetical protein
MGRKFAGGRLTVPDDVDDPRGQPGFYDADDADEVEVDASGWTFTTSTLGALHCALAWQRYYRDEAPEFFDAGRYRAMLEELARRSPGLTRRVQS